ncbi:MAG: hypothetical protein ACM31L_12255 [Actinomycetota bacterium]
MRTFAAAALVLAAISMPALAAPGKKLSELEQIEHQSHQERIAILQEADRCISAAHTPPAYKACERAEGDARKASNQRAKAAKQALREQR